MHESSIAKHAVSSLGKAVQIAMRGSCIKLGTSSVISIDAIIYMQTLNYIGRTITIRYYPKIIIDQATYKHYQHDVTISISFEYFLLSAEEVLK
jgi:hypothetical protein